MNLSTVRTSTGAQAALFGGAAALVSGYGAASPTMTDRARLTSAGMAGIFAAASVATKFHVWAGINAGVLAGTLGALALTHARD